MKTKIFLLLITFLLINFVAAQGFCVDFDKPKWPEYTNLNLTISGNDIQLSWDNATDEPNCSGISHYDIYRNSVFLTSVNGINYLDKNLPDGTYTYIIYPWDLAKHEGVGIPNTITIGISPVPSGGGGGGYSSYWECAEWSECINETQERTCEDISRLLQADRVETRGCFPEFIPTETTPFEEEITEEELTPGFFAGITGGVIGALGTGGMAVLAIILIIIVIGLIIIASRKKK